MPEKKFKKGDRVHLWGQRPGEKRLYYGIGVVREETPLRGRWYVDHEYETVTMIEEWPQEFMERVSDD